MNILITRHDKIGDFITALPMCKVLKEQTNHKIVMMVSKVNVALAKELDFIDDVIEYDEDTFTLLRRLAPFKFDMSISGYIDFNLGFTLFAARIPTRIAPATKIAQIFFNKKVKQRRSEVKKTEWAYNLDLLHKFDESLKLDFQRPLLNLDTKKEDFIIFHTGFGGSSDGNLTLDDYLKLAKKVSDQIKVVFSFGPDDQESKEYIVSKLDFLKESGEPLEATIRDDFKSLWDFTQFISTCKLFVSTSTGPMHLAGLTNTPTMSFFGENLFASSKRWSTVSDIKYQNNYEVPANYSEEFYDKIENKLMEIIND
ncbi:glycosyltransferase family 9 protein [Arcobacteraceae bacterium]|nr:glycosyltransferase family 9 protein [Arcobacteraceae bacterium]